MISTTNLNIENLYQFKTNIVGNKLKNSFIYKSVLERYYSLENFGKYAHNKHCYVQFDSSIAELAEETFFNFTPWCHIYHQYVSNIK